MTVAKFEIEFHLVGLMFHKNGTAIVSRETLSDLRPSNIRENGRLGFEAIEFTKKSRASLAFLFAETTVDFKTFVTLTYPRSHSTDGKEVKRQLNNFLTKLRGRYHNIDYVWFLEFQKRGAPHFHLVLSHSPAELCAQSICKLWADCVGGKDWLKVYNLHRGLYGNRPAVEKILKKDGAKRYALKYALKTEQKAVPLQYSAVGRFWGASRNVKKTITEVDLSRSLVFDENATEQEKLCLINKLCLTDFPEFAPRVIFARQNTRKR